jgi:Trp operon repressor
MAKKEKKLKPKKVESSELVKSNKVISSTPGEKNKKHKEEKPVKNGVIVKHDPLTVIAKFLWSVKEKHLPDVLHDLMTEKEIKEFAERIEIVKQLNKGITQRVIAKNLGISVTTVSRWSKVLQTGKGKLKKYL